MRFGTNDFLAAILAEGHNARVPAAADLTGFPPTTTHAMVHGWCIESTGRFLTTVRHRCDEQKSCFTKHPHTHTHKRTNNTTREGGRREARVVSCFDGFS